MKKVELTFRDMYINGTETVVLEGKAAEAYDKSYDKSAFLANLETVVFEHPYVIKRVDIS